MSFNFKTYALYLLLAEFELLIGFFGHFLGKSFLQVLLAERVQSSAVESVGEIPQPNEIVGGIFDRDVNDI